MKSTMLIVDFCVWGFLHWRKRLCHGRGPHRGFATMVIGDLRLTFQLVAAFCFTHKRSSSFELARVLMRFDHIARFIVNTNHGLTGARGMIVRCGGTSGES